MTYRIKLIDGQWRLLRRGAIIGSFGTKIEAECQQRIEERWRDEEPSNEDWHRVEMERHPERYR